MTLLTQGFVDTPELTRLGRMDVQHRKKKSRAGGSDTFCIPFLRLTEVVSQHSDDVLTSN